MTDPIPILVRFFAIGLLTVGLGACGKTPATSEAEPVVWPELLSLDDLAYRLEVLAYHEEREEILSRRSRLLESGWAVSPATIPTNVANAERVHHLLADLTDLLNSIAKGDLTDDQLFALMEGVHPVVESLIEAAGMPHTHTNEAPDDGNLRPLSDADDKGVGKVEIERHTKS